MHKFKYDIEKETGIPWKKKKSYRYLYTLACQKGVILRAFKRMKVCSIIEKYNLTAYDQQKQTTAESWYRVRKNWSDAKSQIGAYHSLEYAKTCVDKNPGYSVFDEAGVNVYPENVFAPYMVRVKISDLKMRLGATIDTASVGHIPVGSYTIVEEKYGKVSKSGEEGLWGRIKSEQPYNGKYVPVWICLSYTEKV